MSALKNTRTKLGIAQEDMAAYLQVSRSLYAMAETGQRSLPVAALIKFTQLYQSAEVQPVPPAADAAATHKLIERFRRDCQWRAQAARSLLEQYRDEQAKAQILLQTATTLLAAPGNLTERDLGFVYSWQKEALTKLEATGIQQQQKVLLDALCNEAWASKTPEELKAMLSDE